MSFLLSVSRDGHRIRQLPTIAPHYVISTELHQTFFLTPAMDVALANAGHPTTRYVWTEVANPGGRQSPYQNYVHTEGKALLCMSISGTRNANYEAYC